MTEVIQVLNFDWFPKYIKYPQTPCYKSDNNDTRELGKPPKPPLPFSTSTFLPLRSIDLVVPIISTYESIT